ncbi:DNA polymerase III subunit beta [Niveibacterium terrae]|uniref:DNA polymerase III subunit beta n=1 Tax=Niveibacterium terrae TaxID=3373598 RepID=UPI003A944C44
MLLLTAVREALLGPLQSVSGIVEKRHTMPILSNVLIDKKADALTLLATDIEIQIRTHGNASGGEDASLTVGARKLQDILRALPEATEVSFKLDGNRLSLHAGKSRFQLQTLPATDYPRMQFNEEEAIRIVVSQKSFKSQLAQVSYAMAAQDIRYYLNGLLMVVEGGELRMVATDGHRLGFASAGIEGDFSKTEVILPRKTVLELLRQLGDTDEPLEISLSGNQARFSFGPIELITKLIDGKFPDYERVIPKNHPKLVVLSRQALLAALQRVAILTNEKFRGVRIVLSPGSLKIMSTNAEQEEAQEELEVDYSGEGVDTGFNVTYLLDVLTNNSVDQIELHLNDGSASVLFTLPGNENFKYVVMPMRI